MFEPQAQDHEGVQILTLKLRFGRHTWAPDRRISFILLEQLIELETIEIGFRITNTLL